MVTRKIIAIVNNESDHVRVRLNDGRTVDLPHTHQFVSIGDELEVEDSGAGEESNNLPANEAPLPASEPDSELPEVSDEERWKQVLRGSDTKAPEDTTDEPLPTEAAGD